MARSKQDQTAMKRELRGERLQIRITPELKRQLADAARLRGVSMSDFATLAISAAVTKVHEEHYVIEMAREESAWLANLLVDPPAPNEHLQTAAERYKSLIRHPLYRLCSSFRSSF